MTTAVVSDFLSKFVKKPLKKRVRYKIPTYKKSDKIKKNILDYKCNQPHIFRYKNLHNIYKLIACEVRYGQLSLNIGDWRLYTDGLIIYFDEYGNQAEIDCTQNLPVGERLKIHIRLLRFLRQGYKIKKAVKLCKKPLK